MGGRVWVALAAVAVLAVLAVAIYGAMLAGKVKLPPAGGLPEQPSGGGQLIYLTGDGKIDCTKKL